MLEVRRSSVCQRIVFGFLIFVIAPCIIAGFARGWYGFSPSDMASQKGNVVGAWVIVYFAVVLLVYFVRAFRNHLNQRRALAIVKVALTDAILTRPEVVAFYDKTFQAWSTKSVPPLFVPLLPDMRKCSSQDFVRKFPPVPSSALNVFFTRFQPQPNEFLLDLGNEPFYRTEPGWSLVTNKRIIQKDGCTGHFQEIAISDVADLVVTSDDQDLKLVVKSKSGAMHRFRRVRMAPDPAQIKDLAQWAEVSALSVKTENTLENNLTRAYNMTLIALLFLVGGVAAMIYAIIYAPESSYILSILLFLLSFLCFGVSAWLLVRAYKIRRAI